MKLKTFILKNGYKNSYIAKMVGCSQSHLSNLTKGKAKPSFKLMARIIDFTKNKVQFNDFNTDIEPLNNPCQSTPSTPSQSEEVV
jgi:transcriptional regulator with XRE-family HTH domain